MGGPRGRQVEAWLCSAACQRGSLRSKCCPAHTCVLGSYTAVVSMPITLLPWPNSWGRAQGGRRVCAAWKGGELPNDDGGPDAGPGQVPAGAGAV
jgi:hypothetical protein